MLHTTPDKRAPIRLRCKTKMDSIPETLHRVPSLDDEPLVAATSSWIVGAAFSCVIVGITMMLRNVGGTRFEVRCDGNYLSQLKVNRQPILTIPRSCSRPHWNKCCNLIPKMRKKLRSRTLLWMNFLPNVRMRCLNALKRYADFPFGGNSQYTSETEWSFSSLTTELHIGKISNVAWHLWLVLPFAVLFQRILLIFIGHRTRDWKTCPRLFSK